MKKKMKAKKTNKHVCLRCEKVFSSKKALEVHSRAHVQAQFEIKMLQQGRVPVETKFGSEFKGKNKVIVA